MELTDGTILLRPLRDDDVPAVARACDDPDTARFIPGMPSPYLEEHARRYIESVKSSEGRVARAIVDAASGDLLGSIDLRLGRDGSIGYWVAPWARGRGIATRATRLLANWAVTEGGVERLELTTHLENTASQRVAEKAGFTCEGVVEGYLQTPEGPRDSVVFSLRRA